MLIGTLLNILAHCIDLCSKIYLYLVFFFFFERDLYLVLLKGLLDVLNNVFVFWPSPGYLSVSCLQHRYIIINLQWDFVLGKGSSLISCKKKLDFKLTLGFGFKASRLSKKTH